MHYDGVFVAQSLNISRNKILELIEKQEILLNQRLYKTANKIKIISRLKSKCG